VLRVYDRIAPLKQRGATIKIATDHPKIVDVCLKAGADVCLTRADHQSGTDRCAEVLSSYPHQYILNVQGDEPFISISDLERLMAALEKGPNRLGTLVYPNQSLAEFNNPNVVKVVADHENVALYFSRSAIPHCRDGGGVSGGFLQHLGVYAYQRESLMQFCALPQGRLEKLEKLEQLRALEFGLKIQLVTAEHPSIGIDTAEDLKRAVLRFASETQGGS